VEAWLEPHPVTPEDPISYVRLNIEAKAGA
jgi:hypothetical protein